MKVYHEVHGTLAGVSLGRPLTELSTRDLLAGVGDPQHPHAQIAAQANETSVEELCTQMAVILLAREKGWEVIP